MLKSMTMSLFVSIVNALNVMHMNLYHKGSKRSLDASRALSVTIEQTHWGYREKL